MSAPKTKRNSSNKKKTNELRGVCKSGRPWKTPKQK